MYNRPIGLNKLNDWFHILRMLNIKNLVWLDVSIYAEVCLHINVLKDCYSLSVIFTNLFLFKWIYLYILSTDWHKLRFKNTLYIQVLLFHIWTYEMKHMKFFSSNCIKTGLFSISKRLCKGIARMGSDKFVATNNLRIMQNDASFVFFIQLYVVTYIRDW
jgi:hypothetical protein